MRSPINDPRILEYRNRMLGGRLHARDFAEWIQFLLREYGSMKDCLSLGSGIGRVEEYLIRIGFARGFNTIELNPRNNVSSMKADKRICANCGDLNFVRLEPNTYDFVLCHGVLHHLINLEHVIEQVNLALKPDGRLLIYEYVGENRWQFSVRRLNHLRKLFPSVNLKNRPFWSIGGFEAVRSEDLLGLVRAVFGNVCDRSVEYGGVYFPMTINNWPVTKNNIVRVLALDEQISRSGELPPCYHMGIYRKSNAVIPRAMPWSDESLKAKLFPSLPLSQQARRVVLRVRGIVRLRTRLRSFAHR